jgi:hypothetical protein
MFKSWIGNLDFTQIAYYATFIMLLAALVPSAFPVWANGSSKQLGFAVASLGGAIFFFLLKFNLRTQVFDFSGKYWCGGLHKPSPTVDPSRIPPKRRKITDKTNRRPGESMVGVQ